ncbi:uncharacterized protein LOC143305425 [Osmia lignaria lignaria]|uniref:uncharacterized protein LOC143305425 n=1 Tax=Osmia lignaria lignaria TaxID=1437193 RepID=UPI00402B485B
MPRSLRLVLFLLAVVVLVAASKDPSEPVNTEGEPSLSDANDLDADASYWGYSRPWRYGWRGGWGWRG